MKNTGLRAIPNCKIDFDKAFGVKKRIMKLYTRCTAILFVILFCSAVIMGAFSYVGASGNDDKNRVAIKEKIFCYLKERKVSSNDEKLTKIANSVYDEAKDFEIDYRLVLAVMKVESNFKSDAISKKGARGLLQIKPSLAKHVSKETGVSIKSPKCLEEPEKNIRIGVSHLSWLMEKFENLSTALHAYNVGLGKVKPSTSEDNGPDTRFTRKVLTEYQLIKNSLPDPGTIQ
jgi:soluble lytic murein transglycosylase